MRTIALLALAPLLLLSGCANRTSYVRSPDTTLGRIVVYRNGVAYFERYANVAGSELHMAVPADKVDDFLKSLTVVDAVTGEPAPIAYPTNAPADGGTVDMHIELPGAAPHRLKLSYVTESPSWKPSYRVTIGEQGKVGLQAWAIVDNTSGEDWNQVKLGVGASSAMSFRFDLRSVRLVERQTLQSEDLFALAPPTGESTYGGKPASEVAKDAPAENAPPSPTAAAAPAAGAPSARPVAVAEMTTLTVAKEAKLGPHHRAAPRPQPSSPASPAYGYANAADPSAAAHAAAARAAADPSGDPIGTSHFESTAAMNVARGSSAMVSILNAPTEGEIVYLYDPETSRGNATYPFRSVHLKNPTDSALESGPVTVFGEGKFIGEGMCDPIPGRSSAFVPFALDRQIVVEHKEAERDAIARILTVQRGVLSAEVRHTRAQTITLHNRLSEKAVVYVRHTVATGYKLADASEAPQMPQPSEHMGTAQLFRIEVPASGKVNVTLSESTPVTRTTDLRTPEGLDMVKAFVSSDAAAGPLKEAVAQLLEINRSMADIDEHIQTTREEMDEYRARMDELHAQILTLKMVKTAGPLMQSLEKKMQEMSDKLSKGTIDVVALEESLMIAKVRFQDRVADLTLETPKDAGRRASL